jgi:hypothetical protein
VEKVVSLWKGDTSLKEKPKETAKRAPTQGGAAQQAALQAVATRQPITQQSPTNYLNNNLGVSAPPPQQMAVPPPMATPDFNSMYTQDNVTLPDSNFAGGQTDFMAANAFPLDGVGGGFGAAF